MWKGGPNYVCVQVMVEIDIKFDTIIYRQSQGITHEFEGFQKFTHGLGLWVVRFGRYA